MTFPAYYFFVASTHIGVMRSMTAVLVSVAHPRSSALVAFDGLVEFVREHDGGSVFIRRRLELVDEPLNKLDAANRGFALHRAFDNCGSHSSSPVADPGRSFT